MRRRWGWRDVEFGWGLVWSRGDWEYKRIWKDEVTSLLLWSRIVAAKEGVVVEPLDGFRLYGNEEGKALKTVE